MGDILRMIVLIRDMMYIIKTIKSTTYSHYSTNYPYWGIPSDLNHSRSCPVSHVKVSLSFIYSDCSDYHCCSITSGIDLLNVYSRSNIRFSWIAL